MIFKLFASFVVDRKRHFLLVVSVLFLGIVLRAQAQTNTYPWPSTGSIGVGTTSPSTKLDVWAASGDGISLVQSTAPWNYMQFLLDNSGYNSINGGYSVLIKPDGNNSWAYTDTGVGIDIQATSASIATKNAFRVRTGYTGTPTTLFTVLGSGNVGIGTTTPQNLLSVNGVIQAKEVLVNAGWSDYVFDPGYRLRPLTEVATFIQANHHLPDIPSEAEVKEHGVSLGEMQSKLLAKVEELTLHMIELEQENSLLKERVKQVEKSNVGRTDIGEERIKPQ